MPIACSLSPGELTERTARFAALNRAALQSVVREPRVATLTYSATAADELQTLVTLERQCCAFLELELVPRGGELVALRVTAPDVDGADHLLAPFLEGAASLPEGEQRERIDPRADG